MIPFSSSASEVALGLRVEFSYKITSAMKFELANCKFRRNISEKPN